MWNKILDLKEEKIVLLLKDAELFNIFELIGKTRAKGDFAGSSRSMVLLVFLQLSFSFCAVMSKFSNH